MTEQEIMVSRHRSWPIHGCSFSRIDMTGRKQLTEEFFEAVVYATDRGAFRKRISAARLTNTGHPERSPARPVVGRTQSKDPVEHERGVRMKTS